MWIPSPLTNLMRYKLGVSVDYLNQTHCGDGLMSHQPMIETALEQGMSCLFVAKPDDHKYLFEWIAAFDAIPSWEFTDEKGQTHRYSWQNDVPLHGKANAIKVNFCEYQLFNKKGERTYMNSWVTDIMLSKENIKDMVRAGRCRWKIENECFNTLKNQGYDIEHNDGHGEENLSYNMYLLTFMHLMGVARLLPDVLAN